MTRFLIFVLAAVAPLSFPFAAKAETVSGTARVIDGDSLEINGTEIRLHGIDAPEARQTCNRDGLEWLCGAEVSRHLRDLLKGKQVHCEGDSWDRYGRLIARCQIGGPEGQDLGAHVVHSGWALAFRKYSTDYVLQEAEAKNAQRGLWAGQFIPPWEWRRAQRETATTENAPPGNCRIKGNINSKGVKIYHVPGMRDYGATRINRSKGERWFCTEAEAQAAGWRRAK